ncbi:HD-GYP domain-containing protein [Desulfovibrio ferrophilus]|uniref:Metal dependent phosphohydrolase n=1 Tax=Desulfovibrio ferrophilus TaxID=241368 RepID=A0A2Z6AZI0_9BACT|nr:HD domain-containing phosphohydrolase [Desulfovibrio ferrophilus]BBD08600.1 metal dependent phosphohydrolase [Desulfovibrio ferrophilus]
MHNENAAQLQESYISISPLMLVPGKCGRFNVHLLQGREFVLYTKADEQFTQAHRNKLCDHGVCEVYIQKEHEVFYKEYVEDNLGHVLMDDNAAYEERARILHEASLAIVQEAFDRRLPEHIVRQRNFQRIVETVQETVRLLAQGQSFKAIAQFISHDYSTFSHCVHVFLYSSALLQTYDLDEETMVQAGIGAMLHDIGKSVIPSEILLKPGVLTNQERNIIETHTTQGLKLCRLFPLGQIATDCIQHHHEKLDGNGYPMNLRKEQISRPVRAVTIADIYDAMTTNRSYCKAMNPFQVLRIMRDEMYGELDINMFKRFVQVLSGADIV